MVRGCANGHNARMKLEEFEIGLEFYSGSTGHIRMRVTDIGQFNVIAIRVDQVEMTQIDTNGNPTITKYNMLEAEKYGYFEGPPYMLAQHVFDEFDIEACIPVFERMFGEDLYD